MGLSANRSRIEAVGLPLIAPLGPSSKVNRKRTGTGYGSVPVQGATAGRQTQAPASSNAVIATPANAICQWRFMFADN